MRPPPAPPLPELLLLLYTDRDDAVANVILNRRAHFGCEVVAISLANLMQDATVGQQWISAGRKIVPARTAVVNRIASFGKVPADNNLETYFQQQQLTALLHRELRRFAYVSALPTQSSILGSFGSLLDQWLDMPSLLPNLRVPVHALPWDKAPIHGDVYVVNPHHLYSLGTPEASGAPGPGATLRYVRPRGRLLHVAQVGRAFIFNGPTQDLQEEQRRYIAGFAGAMGEVSPNRILEHAFFVGDDLPVFYSTCPVPVLTATLPAYPDLVIQGLHDDLRRIHTRAASRP